MVEAEKKVLQASVCASSSLLTSKEINQTLNMKGG